MKACKISNNNTQLFTIEYYNHTGRIKKETQIRARNMEEAQIHFKFFYPKKFIWRIYKHTQEQ